MSILNPDVDVVVQCDDCGKDMYLSQYEYCAICPECYKKYREKEEIGINMSDFEWGIEQIIQDAHDDLQQIKLDTELALELSYFEEVVQC